MARKQRSVSVKAGDLLHVETPLGIVNIRAGLTDAEGRRVDSIETIPNAYAGEPAVELAGLANTRMIEGDGSERPTYNWGYNDDSSSAHVERGGGSLFDVSLYDPHYTDPTTGVDAQTQSLNDLRELIGYANAAIQAGLQPLPVAEPMEA